MKVCIYCGTESPDESAICSNCGAHEFQRKCSNCGTLLADGQYCPKCGVKAGQKPKVCPNCGYEYYTNACPSCGYIRVPGYENRGRTAAPDTGRAVKPAKRKTWLWVLGWIFIFPLPLTILVARSRKMNTFIKTVLIALAWIVYLFFDLAGETPESGNTDPVIPSAGIAETGQQPGNSADISTAARVKDAGNP